MKTLQDLLAALGQLSDGINALAAAINAQPGTPDFGSVITIVQNITAQVAALTVKLTPAQPAATAPAAAPSSGAAPADATPPAA